MKVDYSAFLSCIYMQSEDKDAVYKDAVYFSMHKFVGGVGSPGNVHY